MDKVYLVTAGAYSDYGVVAAFSNEPAALNYCGKHNTRSDEFGAMRVEVYTLDEEQIPDAGVQYEFGATVWDRNNENDEWGPLQVSENDPTATMKAHPPKCESSVEDGKNWSGNTVYHLAVRGSDYQRVRKVYGEKLAQLKAQIVGVA